MTEEDLRSLFVSAGQDHQIQSISSPAFVAAISTSETLAPSQSRPSTPKPAADSQSNDVSPVSTTFTEQTIWDGPSHVSDGEASDTEYEDEIPNRKEYNEGGISETQLAVADKVHMYRIVDCLQCEMKAMRCDQKRPACSRCIRNGQAELCIARREITGSEIKQDVQLRFGRTVPMRNKAEDAAAWEKKMELWNDLLQAFWSRRDSENWVLPVNDGVRTGFKLKLRTKHARYGRLPRSSVGGREAVRSWVARLA